MGVFWGLVIGGFLIAWGTEDGLKAIAAAIEKRDSENDASRKE